MNLPHHFSVAPHIPTPLEPLRQIAYNLWFSWNADAMAIFRDLDPELWESTGHNPALVLQLIEQDKLLGKASESEYVARVSAVKEKLDRYLARTDRWYAKTHGDKGEVLIAYFSAEFGIHESLQTYSGGLGILAGDHCKSTSDLGLPFVAVGLMYRQGYFIQRLTRDGWQESEHPQLDFNQLPLNEVRDSHGTPVRASVDLPGRKVFIRGWECKVGLSRLFFLDTDLPENSEEDRKITYQLYGGDHEMRIQQEIVLGIGGKRFLLAIGLHPTVFHMNEGHAAFLALERIRRPVKETGADFYSVLQTVAASNVFTTHTPVPAGNDAFSPELMRRYFLDYAEELKISFDEFLRYGRPWQSSPTDPFSMTILALRLSRFCNGVSKIHGSVSRDMWLRVWPGVPAHEIPITHITNGIHTQTWIAPEIKDLLETYLGDIWDTNLDQLDAWKATQQVPDEALWNVHSQLKVKLVDFVRSNVRNHRMRTQEPAARIREVQGVLSPDLLTVGFARRFATYKRAGLLFRDPERLKRILTHPDRPIQFVFAGKAHPADEGGKKLIQGVYEASRREDFMNRVVFVENYDINVARHLYHGVDVWLNNPTRPLEASGTSGEKVCPNGGVNCSVLDGWWAEAWQRDVNGWAVGEQLTTHDPDIQNDFDADSLYALLENVIAPLYYDRTDGVPKRWVQFMKGSIATISPTYSTFRMVQDYTNNCYIPATKRGAIMMANSYDAAHKLSTWKAHIRKFWSDVKVSNVTCEALDGRMIVGKSFQVKAHVDLGKLDHSDVSVESYVESDNGRSHFTFPMNHTEHGEYVGTVEARDSGRYQFNVRVLPSHPLLAQKHELRLIAWAT